MATQFFCIDIAMHNGRQLYTDKQQWNALFLWGKR